jgi:hypothetical protein
MPYPSRSRRWLCLFSQRLFEAGRDWGQGLEPGLATRTKLGKPTQVIRTEHFDVDRIARVQHVLFVEQFGRKEIVGSGAQFANHVG